MNIYIYIYKKKTYMDIKHAKGPGGGWGAGRASRATTASADVGPGARASHRRMLRLQGPPQSMWGPEPPLEGSERGGEEASAESPIKTCNFATGEWHAIFITPVGSHSMAFVLISIPFRLEYVVSNI